MYAKRILFLSSLLIGIHLCLSGQKNYKILVVGDVITTGKIESGVYSYLFPLWEKLFAAGYSVEFIGPTSTSTRIGAVSQAGINTEAGTAENIDATISGTYTTYQADLNAALKKMADEYGQNQQSIKLVNIAEGFNWQTDCVGGANNTHPNAVGAEKIASKWANAIVETLGVADEVYKPDIVTYKQPAGVALQLHIFKSVQATATEKRPAIIYFFGGGWTNGTPYQFYREASYWASKGMVAICADYRIKYTHNTSPIESIKDAKSAIRFFRINREKLPTIIRY